MGACLSACTAAEEYEYETGQVRPLLTTGPRFENFNDIEGAPTDKKWYHASITDHEAEKRLRLGAAGNDNSYLVYNNPRRRGEYVLLVINGGRLHRWKINRRVYDGKYILGNDVPGVEGFGSVRELIKAHRGIRGKPIKTDSGQTLTLSRSYVYYDP